MLSVRYPDVLPGPPVRVCLSALFACGVLPCTTEGITMTHPPLPADVVSLPETITKFREHAQKGNYALAQRYHEQVRYCLDPTVPHRRLVHMHTKIQAAKSLNTIELRATTLTGGHCEDFLDSSGDNRWLVSLRALPGAPSSAVCG